MLIIFSIIIPVIIWIVLLFKVEKGAEDSWNIGVGLYSSLIGRLITLFVFLLSNYQTKNIQKENMEFNIKQLQVNNINLQITKIKSLIMNIYEFSRLIIETQYLNYKNEIKNHCNELLRFIQYIKSYTLVIEDKDFKKEFEEYLCGEINTKVCALKYYNPTTTENSIEKTGGELASTMLTLQNYQIKIEKILEEKYNEISKLLNKESWKTKAFLFCPKLA